MTETLKQIFVQIPPIGIHRHNQIDFLLTTSRFYLLFTLNGVFDSVKNFVISELVDTVPLRKAFEFFGLVFIDAFGQIGSDAGIQSAVSLVE